MKKLQIVILILIVLAVLGIAMLHLCPSFETWVHRITGWY